MVLSIDMGIITLFIQIFITSIMVQTVKSPGFKLLNHIFQ